MVPGLGLFLVSCSTTGERERAEYRPAVVTPEIQAWLTQPRPALPAGVQQGKAEVRDVRGMAHYTTPKGATERLTRGVALDPGTMISTETESIVDLYLGKNGPIVRIQEETILHFEKFIFITKGNEVIKETRLKILKGRLLGFVRSSDLRSVWEVATPKELYRVRSGEIDLAVGFRLLVQSGTVECFANGEKYAIGPGQIYETQSHKIRPAGDDDRWVTIYPPKKPTNRGILNPPPPL